MSFNSHYFIIYFLPIGLIFYWQIKKENSKTAKIALLFISIIFYCFSGIDNLGIIGIIILINYFINYVIYRNPSNKKLLLTVGIMFNVLSLLLAKYTSVFSIPVPLGFSFIIFHLIAYIIEGYKNTDTSPNILDIAYSTLFFPKVAQGPITDNKELVIQLEDKSKRSLNERNLAIGVTLFCMGLAKKVILADTLASFCQYGFEQPAKLSTIAAWVTSLSYTAQIYFDFSGYSDMAIGLAQMFNIDLPINFNSPYKATTIGNFWKRWHISLTQFFTRYVYIPLGGSRKGLFRTLLNTMVIFILSGIWHGSGWNFIIWGGIHGVLMVAEKSLQYCNIKSRGKLGTIISSVLTFHFVNMAWIFFRADSITSAWEILKTMFVIKAGDISSVFQTVELYGIIQAFNLSSYVTVIAFFILVISYLIIWFGKNSMELVSQIIQRRFMAIVIAILLVLLVICLGGVTTEFLYNNF